MRLCIKGALRAHLWNRLLKALLKKIKGSLIFNVDIKPLKSIKN
jgi:hypothetical protein